jgi:hypothetical protein
MAFGDEPRTFELNEDEAQAIRYAFAVYTGTYSWISPQRKPDTKLTVKNSDAMAELLEVLANTPDSAEKSLHAHIPQLQSSYEQSFDLDWENKYEQTAYMIDEDAKTAHALISDLLSQLGF